MRKRMLLITVVALIVVITTSAFAWRSVRSGEKNFERAWTAYVSNMQDKAFGYFKDAGDGFADALAEDPPDHTALFASNLAKAGMSFYFSGRYDQSIEAMGRAISEDRTLWEAELFTALSKAHLGDRNGTIASLEAYLLLVPGQALLSNAVHQSLDELEAGSLGLEKAALDIDEAFFKQIRNNVTFIGNTAAATTDICSGVYWWRTSKSPCQDNKFRNR